jgi:hypothetical protein
MGVLCPNLRHNAHVSRCGGATVLERIWTPRMLVLFDGPARPRSHADHAAMETAQPCAARGRSLIPRRRNCDNPMMEDGIVNRAGLQSLDSSPIDRASSHQDTIHQCGCGNSSLRRNGREPGRRQPRGDLTSLWEPITNGPGVELWTMCHFGAARRLRR